MKLKLGDEATLRLPDGGAIATRVVHLPAGERASTAFKVHPLTSKPYAAGFFDVDTVETMLLLAGVEHISRHTICTWSKQELHEAGDWAIRIHLRASDNIHTRVPPRPKHVYGIEGVSRG